MKSRFFKTNYEKEGIVTSKDKIGLEKYKAQEVKTAIEEIWIIEPRIFSGLNNEQKKETVNEISIETTKENTSPKDENKK